MEKDEVIKLLNATDSEGAALVHYVAALNYHEVIPIIHSFGGNLSVKTSCGLRELTPLMIAAAQGNEKTVKKLMRLGASLTTASSIKPTSSA
jgi:hypothetical protein